MTVRETILLAMISALNTGTPVGVPAAQRSRSLTTDEANSILVYPIRETPEVVGGSGGAAIRCDLRVSIEVRAVGSAGVTADSAADASLSWIGKALAKNRFTDGSGGFYALDVEAGERTWQYEHGENPIVLVAQEMIVGYQHLAANPDART